MIAHPEFEILAPASLLYNCHGYAYSIAQGGEILQIGWKEPLCSFNGQNTTESYVIVPESQVQKGDIVTIIDDNNFPLQSRHSSVIYNNDTLISKMGNCPLFKHSKNDSWFLGYMGVGVDSHCVYYRRVTNTQLTGPSVFDGSGTYTFTSNVTPASCTWSVEPAAMFQTSSGTGYTANLTYATPFTYLAPKATITFTFSYSCDNHYSVSKEIDLLIPTTTISGIVVSDGFVIDTNAIVTVTGEIRTNAEAKTIVPIGTKLIIDGGGMKENGDGMWPGIEVWGNSNADQFLHNGEYSQGYLELKNGATIENAVCAVELWHPGDYSSTGGIIIADSAFFRNNAKAVHAINYTNHYPGLGSEAPYKCRFDNCYFSIDANYLSSNTFYKHIDIVNVKGFSFKGSSFSVTPNITGVSSACCGIAAYDADFIVNSLCNTGCNPSHLEPCPEECLLRSSFSGFFHAIHATHSSGTVQSFYVTDASFTNNDVGVYALNTGYAFVCNSTFSVGRNENCAYGVYVEDVTGFCIEENEFSQKTGFNHDSYGVGVFNCPAPNDVYLNSFEGLLCGNISVGWNVAKTQGFSGANVQGLTYTCNQNEFNTFDFCVLNDNGSGNINLQQGSSSCPAANTFGASAYHFYNDGDDTVDYYYNSNETDQTPDPLLLNRVNRIATTNTNRCASHYGGGSPNKSPIEKAELEKDYITASESFDQLVSLYNKLQELGSADDELAELRSRITQYAHDRSLAAGDLVRSCLYDTIANPHELRTWLRNAKDIASDRLAIASFVHDGDFDNAMKLARTLPNLYELENDELADHVDYMRLLNLHKTLHETGRTTMQLTEKELNMVESIAENIPSVSGSLAKAILENYPRNEEWRYNDCPELPRIPDKGRRTLYNEEQNVFEFVFDVTPNPTEGTVTVTGVELQKAEVYNNMGMFILSEQSQGQNIVLNLGGQPAGIYLVKITDKRGNNCVKKIVKE